MFFETVWVRILETLPPTTYGKLNRICWFIVDDFSRSGSQILHKLAFIFIADIFCSGRKEIPKVWEIATNSWRAVVLSTKVGAYRSLIRMRNHCHKTSSIVGNDEKSLYALIRWRLVLSVSVCRVYTVVYTHKVSWLKTLLLQNSEIYNEWVLHWTLSFFS